MEQTHQGPAKKANNLSLSKINIIFPPTRLGSPTETALSAAIELRKIMSSTDYDKTLVHR